MMLMALLLKAFMFVMSVMPMTVAVMMMVAVVVTFGPLK